MSQPTRTIRAIRFAIEHAEVDPSDTFVFGAQARSALQQAIQSEGDLVIAADACDDEVKRQVTVCRDIDGARAALDLKDQLHIICRRGQLFELGSDGAMRLLD